MKVSLLTYHDEDSYGAILQTYATYKKLQELCEKVELIDLRFTHLDSLLSKLVFCIRRIKHNYFRYKHFNRTRTYRSLEELRKNPPTSDCLIVGSDQTWNPEISKELAMAYFLDFGDKDIKRISYASSIGLNDWKEDQYAPTRDVANALKRFDHILVRENKVVEICKEKFGVDSTRVCDPVLLYPNYDELTGRYDIDKSKMVLFKLVNQEDFYIKSKQIAEKLGYYCVSIGSVRQINGIKCPYPQSINAWVRQIASSSLVFTDSFHGTVLSLLYHKQFVVYVSNYSRVVRIVSLLEEVGLAGRICSPEDNIEHLIEVVSAPIDYNEVDKKMKLWRDFSINQLKKALYDA